MGSDHWRSREIVAFKLLVRRNAVKHWWEGVHHIHGLVQSGKVAANIGASPAADQAEARWAAAREQSLVEAQRHAWAVVIAADWRRSMGLIALLGDE